MFMNICIAICLFILPCHFPRLGLLQCCLNKNKFHVLALYPTPLYIHCICLQHRLLQILLFLSACRCAYLWEIIWCHFVYFLGYSCSLDSFYFLIVVPLQQPAHFSYFQGVRIVIFSLVYRMMTLKSCVSLFWGTKPEVDEGFKPSV
jgi:hypothetical protein